MCVYSLGLQKKGHLPPFSFSSDPSTHTHTPLTSHLPTTHPPPAGTKGIGRASAIELLGLGASVVVTARSAADVAACVGEWRARYGADRVHGFACDVSARDARAALFAFVHKLWGGELDILINNVRAARIVCGSRILSLGLSSMVGSGTGHVNHIGGGEWTHRRC